MPKNTHKVKACLEALSVKVDTEDYEDFKQSVPSFCAKEMSELKVAMQKGQVCGPRD